MATKVENLIAVKLIRIQELNGRIIAAVEAKGLLWINSIEHAMLRMKIENVKKELDLYMDIAEFFEDHIN